MSTITAESLTTNETVPSRSRTFSPEVVAKVNALLNPSDGSEPVKNIGVGTFDKEGAARSALTSLNKLLVEVHSSGPYASTVRQTEDNKYKAIILNKPAKKKAEPKASGSSRKRS